MKGIFSKWFGERATGRTVRRSRTTFRPSLEALEARIVMDDSGFGGGGGDDNPDAFIPQTTTIVTETTRFEPAPNVTLPPAISYEECMAMLHPPLANPPISAGDLAAVERKAPPLADPVAPQTTAAVTTAAPPQTSATIDAGANTPGPTSDDNADAANRLSGGLTAAVLPTGDQTTAAVTPGSGAAVPTVNPPPNPRYVQVQVDGDTATALLAGTPEETLTQLQMVADKYGVQFQVRPSNPGGEGLPKPGDLQMKTATAADEALGLPPANPGNASYFAPNLPEGVNSPADLVPGSDVAKAYTERLQEFYQLAPEVSRLSNPDTVQPGEPLIKVENGLVINVKSGLPYRADTDILDVIGLNGEELPQAVRNQVFRELMTGGPAPLLQPSVIPLNVQHPDLMSWDFSGYPHETPPPVIHPPTGETVTPLSEFDHAQAVYDIIVGKVLGPDGKPLITVSANELPGVVPAADKVTFSNLTDPVQPVRLSPEEIVALRLAGGGAASPPDGSVSFQPGDGLAVSTGLGGAAGILNMYAGTQVDNPLVKTTSLIGGATEYAGSMTALWAMLGRNPALFSQGARLMRVGGPLATIPLSTYGLIHDWQTGNAWRGLGNGLNLTAGVLTGAGASEVGARVLAAYGASEAAPVVGAIALGHLALSWMGSTLADAISKLPPPNGDPLSGLPGHPSNGFNNLVNPLDLLAE